MNSTPINLCGMRASLGPPKSIEPILTPGYELCPCLIKMIQNNYSFSREDDENPYSHLEEFCKFLHACVSLACQTIP
jgi:hypothetical protein